MSREVAALEKAAARLRNAYLGSPVEPLRDAMAPTDADAAYRIQALNTQHWVDQGRTIAGWKVGLTAKAVQKQLGVDQPDFGVLFADMLIPDGGQLDMNNVIQSRGEAEIAVVLGHDIDGSNITAQDIEAAVDYVSPAIEIVDSRVADWKITFADTVADNGSSAYYVLGDSKLPIKGLDLYSCGMVLEVDGTVVSLGAGAACLGHPLNAAAWLANTMVSRGTRTQGRSGDSDRRTGTNDKLKTWTTDQVIYRWPGERKFLLFQRITLIKVIRYLLGSLAASYRRQGKNR